MTADLAAIFALRSLNGSYFDTTVSSAAFGANDIGLPHAFNVSIDHSSRVTPPRQALPYVCDHDTKNRNESAPTRTAHQDSDRETTNYLGSWEEEFVPRTVPGLS
jgi:hypothetical protein